MIDPNVGFIIIFVFAEIFVVLISYMFLFIINYTVIDKDILRAKKNAKINRKIVLKIKRLKDDIRSENV